MSGRSETPAFADHGAIAFVSKPVQVARAQALMGCRGLREVCQVIAGIARSRARALRNWVCRARAWSLRSRTASSTTACRRCSASTSTRASVRLVTKREVAPVGPQLSLGADQAGASDDQSPGAEHRLRDLRFPGLGIVGQGLPVGLRDRQDRCFDGRLLADPDRIRPARGLQAGHDL